jgi:hypothetical protein
VAQRAALWDTLADADAAAAFAAIERLARRPADAVALLRERLRPIVTAPAERTAALLRDLDSPQFETRDQASRALEELGEAAASALRKALDAGPAPLTRSRIELLLERLEAGQTREARAIELLEHLGTADARRLLADLAGGAAGAWRTEQAAAALQRLR